MTDVQPGDRDREAADALIREYESAQQWDTLRTLVARAIAAARAEGYERGRAEGEVLRERVLALADEFDKRAMYGGALVWSRIRAAVGADGDGRLCMCGKPEPDPVHHRPQVSEQEHAYEPAPTEAEFYGADGDGGAR